MQALPVRILVMGWSWRVRPRLCGCPSLWPMSIASLLPPPWLGIGADPYKRYLNRCANGLSRSSRLKGGERYSVKEAILALDAAFQVCSGFDPFDGLPLDGHLIADYHHTVGRLGAWPVPAAFARMPTVAHRQRPPSCDFQVLAWQVNAAKGEMDGQEFRDFCRRVASHG